VEAPQPIAHILVGEPRRNTTCGWGNANVLMERGIGPKGIELCGKGCRDGNGTSIRAEAVKFFAVVIEFADESEEGGLAFCNSSSSLI
jgi:hypothetical protein